MIGQDGSLSREEIATLEKYRDSELFRICRKLISNTYAMEAARLANPANKDDPNEIFVARGRLQGISACYNKLLNTTNDPLTKDQKAVAKES